jgi:protoporphyrinogen oxidase
MYAARRSGLKREMFGYVEGGYRTVLQRFETRLRALGVNIHCGRHVAEVLDEGHQTSVTCQDLERFSFDKVVLTIPCPAIARVCPQLSAAERSRLDSVVYQGIICGSMLVRRPLTEFYITNITDASIPFTAVIEMTALVDRSYFDGLSLVYVPRYLTQDDPLWKENDAHIWSSSFEALERMHPHFRRSDVVATQMGRVRNMLAVTTLNYTDKSRPGLVTSLPNVFVINSAQIANGTLNINETVALADRQWKALMPYLRDAVIGPAGRQCQ